MALNYDLFNLKTKDRVILNTAQLCAYLKNATLSEYDISFLESLRNKLTNDNVNNDAYANEDDLLEAINEVLLKYYIDHSKMDKYELLDNILKFNKNLDNINIITNHNHKYLCYVHDGTNDVISIKETDDLVGIIKKNISSFVRCDSKCLFKSLSSDLFKVLFNSSKNSVVKDYASNFSISEDIYVGKDAYNEDIYRVGNGLVRIENDEIETVVLPSIVIPDDEINKDAKENVKNSELNEFIRLEDKYRDGNSLLPNEISFFINKLDELIEGMGNRPKDSEESIVLDDYMKNLLQVYHDNKVMLSNEDLRVIHDYNSKLESIKSNSRH